MLNKTDLTQIRKVVKEELKNFSTKDDLKNQLAPIKKDITQIRKDTKTIVNFFDRVYLELRKRVERIEEHLNLPSISN